jgi:hypothetical protein
MDNFSSVRLHDDNLLMTHELHAAGYSSRAITRLVKRGELYRIRHGAYTFPAYWEALDDVGRRQLTARAVLRSARVPTVLAGPTAADALGAPVWDLGANETHVARLDSKADRREAGRVPHSGTLLAEDVTIRNGVPVTSGTRTALDVAALADTEHALVVVDGLLHAGETTLPLMERRMQSMAHNPDSLKLPIIFQRADGRHESVGETRASWMMWCHGVPQPDPQFEIRDASGRLIARLDFAWPDRKTFMEFDGKDKYLRLRRPGESVADAVLREKAREQLICGLTGWRCIRIVWADLYRAERTIARINATLAGAPWTA